MRYDKINGREWDCCSLSYSIKKIRGHEMLTHTFSQRIEDRTNQNNNNRPSTILKLKRKSKNMGNITSIMGCYPKNGYIGDTEPALNRKY